jgi:signal transduction histidine kinase
MGPDALTRIFEPFVTKKRDGLGLELAICHSAVTAHSQQRLARSIGEGDILRGVALTDNQPLASCRSRRRTYAFDAEWDCYRTAAWHWT